MTKSPPSKPKPKSAIPPDSSKQRQELAQKLLQRVAGGQLSWKFGHGSLTVDDKVFAFTTRRESVVVKLPGDRVEALLASGVAKRLQMGQRSMREWVELADPLAAENAAQTAVLLNEARAYVASLPASPRKRRVNRVR